MVLKDIVMQMVNLVQISKELGNILENISNDAVSHAVVNDAGLFTYGQTLVNLQLEKELYR